MNRPPPRFRKPIYAPTGTCGICKIQPPPYSMKPRAVGPRHKGTAWPLPYPMCSRAWDVEVEENGEWIELLACGVFTDRIVSHLGGDPTRHMAMGVGYGALSQGE